MENTCIAEKENYPKVIKYCKHKPRDRENNPNASSLPNFFGNKYFPMVTWFGTIDLEYYCFIKHLNDM